MEELTFELADRQLGKILDGKSSKDFKTPFLKYRLECEPYIDRSNSYCIYLYEDIFSDPSVYDTMIAGLANTYSLPEIKMFMDLLNVLVENEIK